MAAPLEPVRCLRHLFIVYQVRVRTFTQMYHAAGTLVLMRVYYNS